LTRARDVANVLSTATSLATDTETAAAISSHNTLGNGHYLRGTTANRPGSPSAGDLYYDTTLDGFIQYTANEGWKLIGSFGIILPTVSGGTLSSDATYYYRSFTSSGTLTISNKELIADILVVAGGGGGGASLGAGAGAGGVQYGTSQTLAHGQNYAVTIGAGGNGAAAGTYSNGSQGNDTTLASIFIAKGGGLGISGATATAGISGGSGGGAAANNGTGIGGSAIAGTGGTHYGNAGGNVTSLDNGAGGGGAGGIGGNVSSNAGGNGGAANSTWSTWLNATGLGVAGAIAGGGGGGCDSNNTGGAAGGGGSTAGTSGSTNASNATANTGSGGGGGGNISGVGGATGKGGNGGSGLLIIRYTKSQVDG
jgi:hypothetical protein